MAKSKTAAKKPKPSLAKKPKKKTGEKRTKNGLLGLAADHVEAIMLNASHANLSLAVSAAAMSLDDGAYAAKAAVVVRIVSTLLMQRAPETFKKVDLNGKMDDDYHFTAGDFPPFLDKVAAQLASAVPSYELSVQSIGSIAQQNLSSIGLRVCSAIEEAATP